MTKKTDVKWTAVPLENGQSTDEVQRPFHDVEFEPEIFQEIAKFENHGVVEENSHLDAFQQKHYPYLGSRTALTLVIVVREIAKECMWRYLEALEQIETDRQDAAEMAAGEDW